jgi:hypothetical protein
MGCPRWKITNNEIDEIRKLSYHIIWDFQDKK